MRRPLVAAALALGLIAPRPALAAYYGPPAFSVANALSELIAAGSQAAARANLGLGTAATVNTGTSGGNIPLLNTANTWSGSQTFSSGALIGNGSNLSGPAGGGGVMTIQSDGNTGNVYAQFWGSSSPNPGLLAIGAVKMALNPSTALQVNNVPLSLQKLSAAPTTAPGAGYLSLFVVASSTSGACKLQAMAGTSTTPVTIADPIGSGC